MADEPSQGAEQVRAAEVIGALCLATDLGMGFPFEHGLHTTLAATRLADRLGVDPATASQVYYACLLSHAGCTTDAHVTAEVFGASLTTHLNPVLYGSQREVLTGLMRALPEPEGPAPARAMQVARGFPKVARLQRPHFTAMCEVAQMLADGVGLPPSTAGLLAYMTERWDGKGPLRRAKGEEIPLPMRIVHVAVDATFQRWLGGVERAARLAGEHAGRGLDPEVAACVADDAEEILALDPEASAWAEVLACEPRAPPDARRSGDRPGAVGDGRLRGPDLALPDRPLGRRRGARSARRQSAAGWMRRARPRSGAPRSSTTLAGSRSAPAPGSGPGR